MTTLWKGFLDQLETERRPGLIKFGNSDVVYILCANDNHWIVKSNIDFTKEPNNDFDNYDLESDRMNWFMYDTLNSIEHATSCSKLLSKAFPDDDNCLVKMVKVQQQNGIDDCGAFAYLLCQRKIIHLNIFLIKS